MSARLHGITPRFASVGIGAILLLGCFDDPPASETDGTGADETAAEMTVSISGTVVASWLPPGDTPVQGTLVELLDEPGVSAVTDAEGRFTIEGVTAGEPAYFAVAPSAHVLRVLRPGRRVLQPARLRRGRDRDLGHPSHAHLRRAAAEPAHPRRPHQLRRHRVPVTARRLT